MPRIDYDEDDQDHDRDGDRDDDDAAGWPLWRRRLLIASLAAIGLGLGFLIPYTVYLNRQVTQRFGQLQWQIPTRVYARPLALAPGVAMDAATLKVELAAASYREDSSGRPGTYTVDGSRWTIASRGFRDVDGAVPASRIEATLANGRVAALRDTTGGQAIKSVRLDIARIATLYGQNQEERKLVRIEDVPELLVTGLQAVEDRDFAHHHGIDLSGMLRAAFITVSSGGANKQGASTLTQQLARSGLLGIGREQTVTRKLNEILFALLIEARYDKRTILEAYFNQVYIGQRGAQAIRGVAAGSEFWFGRELSDLSTEQIAMLIGIVKGPSAYDPRRHPLSALQRRNYALSRMRDTGLIDAAAYQRAKAAPLGVTTAPGSTSANRYPAYVDLVRRQLVRDYPADALQGAGLSVMTGMAPSAQLYAESAVAKTLSSLGTKGRPALQSGMVVTDVHDGDVLAVVGSRDYAQPGFNRAIEAKRPVGSLLKPFVYLRALSQANLGWSLATWVDDSPVSVVLDNGKRWTPGNSDGRSHGSVRLIDALAHSYNQATVRVGMQVGPKVLADLIHTLAGIDADGNPSLILGSVDESPYVMAQLYQFLASGGEVQPLHLVRGVIDRDGRTVKRYDTVPRPAQPGDSIVVRLITLGMQYTVTSGTARQLVNDGLGSLGAAGKTGTSNDGRDSWFAGFTGDHLAVIWVGNDQNEQTGLYGATGAMRVWSGLFKRLPTAPLRVPDAGLDWQWVVQSNATDAGCPSARRFAFAPGYAPSYQPCVAAQPDGGGDLSQQAADGGGGWRSWFGLDKRRGSGDQPATPTPSADAPSSPSSPATPAAPAPVQEQR